MPIQRHCVVCNTGSTRTTWGHYQTVGDKVFVACDSHTQQAFDAAVKAHSGPGQPARNESVDLNKRVDPSSTAPLKGQADPLTNQSKVDKDRDANIKKETTKEFDGKPGVGAQKLGTSQADMKAPAESKPVNAREQQDKTQKV